MVAISLGGATQAAPKIPVSVAALQCEKLAKQYSRSLSSPTADVPTPEQVNLQYRSCVYAKSGQYPPRKKTEPGIRISGSAAIGVVVSD